jgi:hypothetical protein
MRIHVLAAMAVLVAAIGWAAPAPVRAQDSPHINLLQDQPSKTPEEKEQEAERDRKYKDSLRKIPDAKASSDPWGSVRSDAPKTATTKTPAAPKAKKTGNAQN